LLWPEA
jgi:hypothetical protein